MKYTNIGEFKVTKIRETAPEIAQCDSPERALEYWQQNIATNPAFDEEKEMLVVVVVNTKLYAKGHNIVSIGSINESIAHPREIFKPVIVSSGYGFVLMHNHPSQNTNPSEADLRLTRRIREGAELLQIRFMDHVIVGNGYYSFKEAGLL